MYTESTEYSTIQIRIQNRRIVKYIRDTYGVRIRIHSLAENTAKYILTSCMEHDNMQVAYGRSRRLPGRCFISDRNSFHHQNALPTVELGFFAHESMFEVSRLLSRTPIRSQRTTSLVLVYTYSFLSVYSVRIPKCNKRPCVMQHVPPFLFRARSYRVMGNSSTYQM